MRATWLRRTAGEQVTLFFNGWGMDERAVKHLTGKSDVIAFHDYREVNSGIIPGVVAAYDIVDVVAWSMGVWAAATLLAREGIAVRNAVALNVTERPVDDLHGIPTRSYALTERGMNARGRERFFDRMLDNEEEREAFRARCLPRRSLEEQIEELRRIREQAAREQPRTKWSKAFISREDVIFPAGNQKEWWKYRCEITCLDGAHYPFFRFSSWDSIINHGITEHGTTEQGRD